MPPAIAIHATEYARNFQLISGSDGDEYVRRKLNHLISRNDQNAG
jgi:hypothetical protein